MKVHVGLKMEDLHGDERTYACTVKIWAFIKYLAHTKEGDTQEECKDMDRILGEFLSEYEAEAREEFTHLMHRMKYNDSKIASA